MYDMLMELRPCPGLVVRYGSSCDLAGVVDHYAGDLVSVPVSLIVGGTVDGSMGCPGGGSVGPSVCA